MNKLPSKIEQAYNLLQQSIASAKGAVSNGKLIADLDKQNKRWLICKSCEYIFNKNRCTQCGCIMPFKVRLEDAKCPISKW